MTKSTTDLHWEQRAASVADDIEVNIMDIFQREAEYDHVCRYLAKDMRVLEVGCGNGFSTARFRPLVSHLDAFDYSESMIARAKDRVGETNNVFFVDNLLEPRRVEPGYDAVVCVRVLINLRDLAEQRLAVANLASFVRPGGLLVLAEGFTDGFVALNRLRDSLKMPPIEPAAINFYSSSEDLLPDLLRHFTLEDRFHLGAYDYLTRAFYPSVVGAENAKHNTVFSQRCAEMARSFNPDCFAELSRIQGMVLRKLGE
jgi:SAM-dependent methyltransferase